MQSNVIIFDLDDTLYKEIEYLKSAYREIANQDTSNERCEVLYQQMLSWYQRGENVFECLTNFPESTFSKMQLLQKYRSHFPDLKLKKEYQNLLSWLVNQHLVIGIITDGRSITQRNKINALELTNWIAESNIVISEEFGSEKPDERNFRFFMDKYPDANYWYIGDNLRKDFITPNRLGWKTICLKDDGENIHKQDFDLPVEFHPNHLITELQEIKKYI